jgi:hypothetical protein
MLSPATLNRVSASYARGYRDGYASKLPPTLWEPVDPFDRPFANFDYVEGYKAGANDARCAAKDRAR